MYGSEINVMWRFFNFYSINMCTFSWYKLCIMITMLCKLILIWRCSSRPALDPWRGARVSPLMARTSGRCTRTSRLGSRLPGNHVSLMLQRTDLPPGESDCNYMIQKLFWFLKFRNFPSCVAIETVQQPVSIRLINLWVKIPRKVV